MQYYSNLSSKEIDSIRVQDVDEQYSQMVKLVIYIVFWKTGGYLNQNELGPA